MAGKYVSKYSAWNGLIICAAWHVTSLRLTATVIGWSKLNYKSLRGGFLYEMQRILLPFKGGGQSPLNGLQGKVSLLFYLATIATYAEAPPLPLWIVPSVGNNPDNCLDN